ncbi:hypothetical protein O999_13225 [Pseudomonas putida LF54]|jgi:uncharacterized protein RhaS with RHS repeats|nr:hypothetical protein O999_13225 [Pseudomonas putida LF54]POF96721.1 hypothetical protein BGP81_08275 [Pseudomonas putida]
MYVSGRLEGTGRYRYDSLGRRVAKRAEINGEVEQKRFLWQGIANAARRDAWAEHLYLYEPGSYGRWRGLIRLKGKNRRSITSIRIRLVRRWS